MTPSLVRNQRLSSFSKNMIILTLWTSCILISPPPSDVRSTFYSPPLDIANFLRGEGADLFWNDPMYGYATSLRRSRCNPCGWALRRFFKRFHDVISKLSTTQQYSVYFLIRFLNQILIRFSNRIF